MYMYIHKCRLCDAPVHLFIVCIIFGDVYVVFHFVNYCLDMLFLHFSSVTGEITIQRFIHQTLVLSLLSIQLFDTSTPFWHNIQSRCFGTKRWTLRSNFLRHFGPIFTCVYFSFNCLYHP